MSHAAASLATSETHPMYFLLRRLHSLTGIMFGLYICVHLLINATLIQGRGEPHHAAAPATQPTTAPVAGVPSTPEVAKAANDATGSAASKVAEAGEAAGVSIFQQQVDKIHSLPFLLAIEMSFIFLPIIVHTIYGIYVMKNGKPNVGSYGYVKNWFYVLQRVSAVALILFIVFHVGGMFGWFEGLGAWWHKLTFEPHGNAFDSTVRHVQASPILSLVVYPLGVIAGTFHLANGFWTAAIAWGLTVSHKAQARWGVVCLGLFFFTTACGFTAIAATFIYNKPGL